MTLAQFYLLHPRLFHVLIREAYNASLPATRHKGWRNPCALQSLLFLQKHNLLPTFWVIALWLATNQSFLFLTMCFELDAAGVVNLHHNISGRKTRWRRRTKLPDVFRKRVVSLGRFELVRKRMNSKFASTTANVRCTFRTPLLRQCPFALACKERIASNIVETVLRRLYRPCLMWLNTWKSLKSARVLFKKYKSFCKKKK